MKTIKLLIVLVIATNICSAQVTIKDLEAIVKLTPQTISNSLPYGYKYDYKDGSTTYWVKENTKGGIATTPKKGYIEVQYSFFDTYTFQIMNLDYSNYGIRCGSEEIPDDNNMVKVAKCSDYTYRMEVIMYNRIPVMYSVIVTKTTK